MFERFCVLTFVEHLWASTPSGSPAARTLLRWLSDNTGYLRISSDAVSKRGKALAAANDNAGKLTKSEARWLAWGEAIVREREVCGTPETDTLTRCANLLSAMLNLDDSDRDIFVWITRIELGGPLEYLCDRLVNANLMDSDDVLALLTGISKSEIWHRMRKGKLETLGLIDASGNYSRAGFVYYVPYRIFNALTPPNETSAQIERSLLGPVATSDLSWADFEHLEKTRGLMSRVLKGAAHSREEGVNILLYGPPGTGKTELCKMIAGHLGLGLRAVGETTATDREPSRWQRLSALLLAQRIAAPHQGTILLFDEVEDLLGGGRQVKGHDYYSGRQGSKVFVNRLFENNPTPTLWTSNTIEAFDPAILRRMTLVLEIRKPPASVRRTVWQRLIDRAGIDVTDTTLTALARDERLTIGAAANIVRAVGLAKGGEPDLLQTASAMATALDGGRKRHNRRETSATFDADLASTDRNLPALMDQLSKPATPHDFSLCLYGAPGTGKTAFARALAAQLDKEVLLRRGSDLMSKWLGESEQNIAAAFAEARDSGKLLLIDEADTFLRDRAGAEKPWEVSIVNEMLTWMEDHPEPFVCTTNLLDQIDKAALRRFTFKVKFGTLDGDRAIMAFERFFGRTAPALLARLDGLTPADFALIAREARFLGEPPTDAFIVKRLQEEVELRHGARRIGF